MKKLLLLLVIFCGLLANSSAQTFEIGAIKYNVVSAVSPFTVEVVAKTPIYTGAVTIPAQVTSGATTYSVVRIGQQSFQNCVGLTSVTMPNSVIDIYPSAFAGCSALTNVVLSTSLKYIRGYVFSGCSSLAQISLPATLQLINIAAFRGCTSLKTVTIPASVNSIVQGAFAGCTMLTSFVVNGGNTTYKSVNGALLTLDATTLVQCPAGLSSYSIPASVTTLAYGAFGGCSKLTELSLPSTITTIEAMTFENCTGLTSMVLPEGLLEISDQLFRGCTNLDEVFIPKFVTSIGVQSFMNCTALNSIYCNAITPPGIADATTFQNVPTNAAVFVPSPTVGTYKSSVWQSFSNIAAITLPSNFVYKGIKYSVLSILLPFTVEVIANTTKYEGDIVIPTQVKFNYETFTVTEIGYQAFVNNTLLTTLTMPNTVTIIEHQAFFGCQGLKSVVFSNTLKEIRGTVFCNCTSLTNLVLPSSLTTLYSGAFTQCTSLTTVTIPAATTNIYEGVFARCSKLTSIAVANGNTAFKSVNGALLSMDGTNLLQCPAGLASYTIPASVTKLGESSFEGCDKFTSIVLPSTISTIYPAAFSHCTNLTAVNLPPKITTIANDLFFYCGKLKSVSLPNGLTSIGNTAFGYCIALETVSIPSTVTTIESAAFLGDEAITSISCNAVTPPIVASNTTFMYVPKTIPLLVPVGSESAYLVADYWKDFTNINPAAASLIEPEMMDVIVLNPISRVLKIDNLETASLVELFNAQGALLLKEKVGGSMAEFYVESLSKGNYIVRVSQNGKARIFRVVKI